MTAAIDGRGGTVMGRAIVRNDDAILQDALDPYGRYLAKMLASPITVMDRAVTAAEKIPPGSRPSQDSSGAWQDAIEAGTDAALNYGVLSSVVPKPPNSIGVFGGRTSKTADLEKLRQAQDMSNAGIGPDDIWKNTGWFKDKGNWKYEIPDNNLEFKPRDVNAMPYGKFHERVSHPELTAAYPDMVDNMIVGNVDLGDATQGMYQGSIGNTPKTSSVSLSRSLQGYNKRPTMVHELQHGIQGVEGWSPGTSPSAVGYERYMGNPGEIEARAAARRLGLSPEARRVIPPWDSSASYTLPIENVTEWLNDNTVASPVYGTKPDLSKISEPKLRYWAADKGFDDWVQKQLLKELEPDKPSAQTPDLEPLLAEIEKLLGKK